MESNESDKVDKSTSGQYVFISYKSEEKTRADKIKSFLEQNDFKWWMAPDSLDQMGTQDYSADIFSAIRECSCLIFAVSPSSLSSKWVNREVKYAMDKCGKPIIPFVVSAIPDEIQEKNPLFIILAMEKQILNSACTWDMEVLMPYLNKAFGCSRRIARSLVVASNGATGQQENQKSSNVKTESNEGADEGAEQATSLLKEGMRLEWTDPPKAVTCFREAASLWNREAWHHYGDMLFNGRGVKKDVDAAFVCYRKCDDSDAWIQYNLGRCHLHFAQERGDLKEGVEAVAWLRKSAERGVPWACVKMGDCYRDGIGVQQDDGEAMKWYRHALEEEGRTTYADVGAVQWAEFCIGCLFRDGRGVGKDPAEALRWFHKAALRDSDAADSALTAAAEVLAEREGGKLDWRQFRIIHGVRIRDASGRWVPLAGLVASNRGIFVGVFCDVLQLNIRNSLPNDNPAWPFALSISEHCGIPEGCFGAAVVVPETLRGSGVDFPFWAVQESHLTDVMLNASVVEPPDWLGNRQDIIRKLETLPMSSEGAEKNALMHFNAPVPEWEDGAELLEKVEQPSRQLIRLAEQAVEELERSGKSSIADNIRTWLVKKDALKTGVVKMLILPGGAKMEMIYCAPGEFVMGSPEDEKGRDKKETQHKVKLTKGFWLGRCPITQEQWQSVMGSNPSHFKGDAHLPVENISWHDCKKFVEKVKSFAKQQLGGEARFPTEAEWEYACRAGTRTAYYWGNALNGDKATAMETIRAVPPRKARAWGRPRLSVDMV